MNPDTILVTGGNKGIGYGICDGLLAADPHVHVIMTGRHPDRGHAAHAELAAVHGGERISFELLDVTDVASIARLAALGLEFTVIINNAGIATKGQAINAEIARNTITTNCFGAQRVIRTLLPCLREGGRIVNVASTAGRLGSFSDALRKQFMAPLLTEDDVAGLMRSFIDAVANGNYDQDGWPSNTYSVSKAGMNALTRIWHRGLKARGIVVNSCCPGWCRTDMGGANASLSAAQGADTPVWLALGQGGNEGGGFYRERQPIAW
jgi:carbonyl reductase 1